ncbi:MAG: tetratricopeptide repeat protein [Rhizomicrobium sp.]|jgi:Flp pilus assembly protein TadD
MNRISVWAVTGVLCTLSLGACSSTAPDAAKPQAMTAPEKPQAPDPALKADADIATIAKDLPGTLDGEVKRAQLLRSRGDLDDASHSLAQLMLVAPDDARVVGEYGKVLVQQGHPQTALPYLKRAAEMQPKDWTLFSAMGVAYDQTDDHTHARVAYEHALELAPNQPAVLNNLAVSHMLAGDLSGAQKLLAQAAVAGSQDPKIASNSEVLASLKPAAPAAQKPAASASKSPAPAATKLSSVSPNREAVAPPKPLTSAVVMQAVPVDPLAGPVKPKTSPKPANGGRQKPTGTAAAPSAPPALRTAAEAN